MAGNGARLLPLLGTVESARAANGAFTLSLPPRTAIAYKLVVDEKAK
jgi:hypothetical protein